ncbi:MAG TPA: hypothetical protein VF107_01610 [Burkholderiaceae bacterium]
MSAVAVRPNAAARRASLRTAACAALLGAAALVHAPAHGNADAPLAERLSDTGLYATGSTTQTRPGVFAFAPQHALWSDGADKQRWIALPPGASIDASDPDAWQFPPGTRLWKEFSHAGRRIETRTIERLRDGSWRYATYLWRDDGRDALLAPASGVSAWPVAQAPGGRYTVPSRTDCTGCHDGAASPVLGFSALQQSPALGELVALGMLRDLPPALLNEAPRIAARTATELTALGYLHANCGHCHNRSGAGVPVRLTLAQSAIDPEGSRAATMASAVGAGGRFRTPAWPDATHLIEPGAPARSTLALRMGSRDPRLQMPPLGSHVADDAGLRLIERWIEDLSVEPRSVTP